MMNALIGSCVERKKQSRQGLPALDDVDGVSNGEWTLEKLAASWENQQCGLGTGPTQTGLCMHRRWLETGNFGFRK